MSPMRIVKVGGSLLDLPDLKERLHSWQEQNHDRPNLYVAGGGKLVDGFRQFQQRCQLPQDASHRLALQAMALNSLRLSQLTNWPLVRYEEINTSRQPLLNASSFVDLRRMPGVNKRTDWDFTSDSLTAVLARQLKTGELVLLKSSDPPADDLVELARHNFVDRAFPEEAAQLPAVRFCNLRASEHTPRR